MLLLKCPRCKKDMKYQSLDGNIDKKKKVCVYCGKSFSVKDRIVKKMSRTTGQ